jgi:hypothetical protein
MSYTDYGFDIEDNQAEFRYNTASQKVELHFICPRCGKPVSAPFDLTVYQTIECKNPECWRPGRPGLYLTITLDITECFMGLWDRPLELP